MKRVNGERDEREAKFFSLSLSFALSTLASSSNLLCPPMCCVVAGSSLLSATHSCASASCLSFPRRRQGLRRCRVCPPRSLERFSPVEVNASSTPTTCTSSSSSSTPSSTPATAPPSWRTCRHCKRRFDPSQNPQTACRRHPALFTGGEVSKAIGFCREAQGREFWLDAVVGASGLLRFYDCCGAGSEDAPGCVVGPHEGF